MTTLEKQRSCELPLPHALLIALQVKRAVSLRFLLTVEASAEGGVKADVSKDLQKILEDISDSFH
jgi:hypothetical protein